MDPGPHGLLDKNLGHGFAAHDRTGLECREPGHADRREASIYTITAGTHHEVPHSFSHPEGGSMSMASINLRLCRCLTGAIPGTSSVTQGRTVACGIRLEKGTKVASTKKTECEAVATLAHGQSSSSTFVSCTIQAGLQKPNVSQSSQGSTASC